ncbi:MAG: DUF5606 domain-containing protein [Prevotellaceae bacterium]|jgi:hypothetical protein|nr:DUF5606 domain-containing protein [Prevotellaceae bacterium]
MLKKILSLSGKPGLYRLISQGRNMLVVESLINGKRMPSYAGDNAVSLGDIAVFTTEGDVPLAQVLENIKIKENGGKTAVDPKSDHYKLRAYMVEVLPNYDKDRVYPSDIKKMLTWYNLLIDSNITDFLAEEKKEPTEE